MDSTINTQNLLIRPRLTEIPMAILWERIENMLTETNEPYIRSTINTLKKLQEERTRNICSDPIIGKELKTNKEKIILP